MSSVGSTLRSLPDKLPYLPGVISVPFSAAGPATVAETRESELEEVPRRDNDLSHSESATELRSVLNGMIDGHQVDKGSPDIRETELDVEPDPPVPPTHAGTLRGEERWDDLSWLPPIMSHQKPTSGRLHIFVIRVSMDQKLVKISSPYISVTLGDQVYETVVSGFPDGRWNAGFDLGVPLHFQLFGSIQLDLFNANSFLADRHIGRAEIRLSELECMPNEFVSWYEIWDKEKSLSNISHPALQKHLGASTNLAPLPTPDTTNSAHERSSIPNPTETSTSELMAEASTTATAKDLMMSHPVGTPSNPDDPKKSRNETSPSAFGVDLKSTSSDRARAPSESLQSASTTESHIFVDPIFSSGSVDDGTLTTTILDGIASATSSTELLSLVRVVAKLLALFGQGVEYTNLELFGGLKLLEKYYRTYHGGRKVGRDKGLKEVKKLEAMAEAKWNWRFAMAAYGWVGITFQTNTNGAAIAALTPGKLLTAKPDAASVVDYLQIPKEHLLDGVFNDSKVFIPVYYVAVDQSKETIVFAIRGSLSARDALTDLICLYDRYNGGFVHSGMLRAAQWFLANEIPKCRQYLKTWGYKKLRIVGHSLVVDSGPSLWVDHTGEGIDGIEVSCWAFASPAVASKELTCRPEYKAVIKTVVVAYDLVPRMSYGSFSDLKALLICAVEASRNDSSWDLLKVRELFCGYLQVRICTQIADRVLSAQFLSSTPSNPPRTLEDKLSLIHECRYRLGIDQPSAKPLNPKLFPVGEILYLLKPEDEPGYHGKAGKEENIVGAGSSIAAAQKARQRGDWRLFTVDATEFDEIIIRMSMFVDHFPSTYDGAFTSAFYAMMIRSGRLLRDENKDEEVVLDEMELKDLKGLGRSTTASSR
ncbi:hypothetical protein HDU93_007328 [Gonapodya sp. JEL0774]|nr:hypothetical protein HDU93_007328 [Gonapodya sp. JEL0774]